MNAGNNTGGAMLGGVNDLVSGSDKNNWCRIDEPGVTTEHQHSVYTSKMLFEPHLCYDVGIASTVRHIIS
jgi:hypothetical protein